MSDDGTRTSLPDEHTELAAAWVLHALDTDQEAEFLAHLELEGCEECTRVVAETMEVLEALAHAVPQDEPPADLRYRLLAAAEAERPQADEAPATDVPFTGSAASRNGRRPSGGDGVAPSRGASRRDGTAPSRRDGSSSTPDRSDGTGDGTGDGSRDGSTTVVPMRPRRRLASRALTAVAAAAAVVVIGGLVVTNQSLRSERDDQATTVQQYDRIVDVMRDAGAPGATSAPLAGPNGALVGLVVDQGVGPEVLTTSLGANPTDQTYVLWALAGPAPTPLGVFDVPAGGASVRSVPSSPVAGPVAGYAVSLEPGRTAPATPTRIVASGQVGR